MILYIFLSSTNERHKSTINQFMTVVKMNNRNRSTENKKSKRLR